VKALLVSVVAAFAVAAALAPVGGATNECHGIQSCIRVPGPWVVVPPHGGAQFVLTCPGGRSVVAGLDAQVTSRAVHVEFDARLGAPVQPGVSTTRYAMFRAFSTSAHAQLFQPLLGCVPAQGGGGRSTVSARVTPPGPSIEDRSHIVVVGPGTVRFGSVACRASEQLIGAWDAIAFRTKQAPAIGNAVFVKATHHVVKKKVVLTASAGDALSIDVHAIVQVGAVCAP
jgi:hypothetical protein